MASKAGKEAGQQTMIELQKNVRESSHVVDDYLRDLNSWTKEMKELEQDANKTETKSCSNTKSSKSGPAARASHKLKQIPVFDYEHWEMAAQTLSRDREGIKADSHRDREKPCSTLKNEMLPLK